MAYGSTFPITAAKYGGSIGILSAQIISLNGYQEPGNQNSLGVASERYSVFLAPCETVDAEIIRLTDENNSDLDTIISTSASVGVAISFASDSEAQTALDNLYSDAKTNNYPNSLNVGWADTSGIGSIPVVPNPETSTFTEGDLVYEGGGAYGFVAFTTTSSQVYLRSVVGVFSGGSISSITSGEPAPGDPTVGFATGIYTIGIASVHHDVSLIESYGNLEPPNASAENPYGGYSSPILTSSNQGLGIGNTFFKNGIDTGDGGNRLLNSLSGNIIAFSTSTYPSQANIIFNTVDEIETNRVSIGTFTSSANNVKPTKTGYALNVWAYSRGNYIADQDVISLQSTIDILENL